MEERLGTQIKTVSFKVSSRLDNPVLSYLLHSGPEVGAISQGLDLTIIVHAHDSALLDLIGALGFNMHPSLIAGTCVKGSDHNC